MWNILARLATSSKSEINNNDLKRQNKKKIETKNSTADNTLKTNKVKNNSLYSKNCQNNISNVCLETPKIKLTKPTVTKEIKSKLTSSTHSRKKKNMLESKTSLSDKICTTGKVQNKQSFTEKFHKTISNISLKKSNEINAKPTVNKVIKTKISSSTISSCRTIKKSEQSSKNENRLNNQTKQKDTSTCKKISKTQKKNITNSKTFLSDNVCTISKVQQKQPFTKKCQNTISNISLKKSNETCTKPTVNKKIKTKLSSSTTNSCRTAKMSEQSCKQIDKINNPAKQKTTSCYDKNEPNFFLQSTTTNSCRTTKISEQSCKQINSPVKQKTTSCYENNEPVCSLPSTTTNSCRTTKISEQSCKQINSPVKQKTTSCYENNEPLWSIFNSIFQPPAIVCSPPLEKVISLGSCVPKSEAKEDMSKVKCKRKPSKQSCVSDVSRYYTTVQCPTNIFIKLQNCTSDSNSVKCTPNRKCEEKSEAKQEEDESECPFIFTLGP